LRGRIAAKRIAQAAAVVIIAGSGYFFGHRTQPAPAIPPLHGEGVTAYQPVSYQQPQYSIAETRTLSSKSISPNIEGRPNIDNVQFVDADPSDGQIGLAFDITQHVTVTGAPTDKS